MSTVKDNLIAARALIDTTEKFRTKSAMMAVIEVPMNNDVWLALKSAVPAEFVHDDGEYAHTRQYQYTSHPDTTHADIISLFDRAIAAQP